MRKNFPKIILCVKKLIYAPKKYIFNKQNSKNLSNILPINFQTSSFNNNTFSFLNKSISFAYKKNNYFLIKNFSKFSTKENKNNDNNNKNNEKDFGSNNIDNGENQKINNNILDKVKMEFAYQFNDLTPDFNDFEKLEKFIELCSEAKKNKTLKENFYIKYIEKILNKKIESKYSNENLLIIIKIMIELFNTENQVCLKKWDELMANYLMNNKSMIDFTFLINNILLQIHLAQFVADKESNNIPQENHDINLKKNIVDKIFDIFIIDKINDFLNFVSCNYKESNLLIRLFTHRFLEKSIIIYYNKLKFNKEYK